MKVEDKVFEVLENLINEKISIREAYEEYEAYVKSEKDINSSKINAVKRSILSYIGYRNSDSGISDLITNIRQVTLNYKRRIKVPFYIKEEIYRNEYISDLYIDEEGTDLYLYTRKAEKFLGQDSKDYYEVYDYSKVEKHHEYVAGDIRLKNMTGYDSYSSNAQKLIIRAMENQIDGTTLLAVMPTGGGKSLTAQFVSYYEKQGTTIVVVPTIALALDQCKSSEKFFTKERKARAYCDGVTKEEKDEIIKELGEGKIAILYLSPESIMNGIFHDKILQAAKKGLINRFVIDEAHIVSDWGDFFRTEFQFLSLFRRKLIEVSKGKLKTVLLSATITRSTEELLKNLYSESDNFIQIRGDSLRDEIIYYKSSCRGEKDRERKLLELVHILPRPLIIYVPVIERASEYCEAIKNMGFNRVRTFTSQTDADERKKILKAWDEDRIDIIIATSAFGMGVNKREIRTVVHTFVPENTDRFYQEVGRGGRDGLKALSVTLTSSEADEDYINYFTRNKVISVDKLIERWQTISKENIEIEAGDETWVSVESVPDRLKDGYTGKLNESWNEYVILFMYKLGIIDIKDIKMDSDSYKRRILIKLKRLDLINDIDKMIDELTPIRDKERKKIDKEIHYVKEMIAGKSKCWGECFSKAYDHVEDKCSGCPVCRRRGKDHYYEEDYLEITEGENLVKESFVKNRTKEEELVFIEEDYDIKEVLNHCIRSKIDCLIFNDDMNIKDVDYLRAEDNRIFFYNYEDFLEKNDQNYIYGNVAVFLSSNNSKNNKLFNKLRKFEKTGTIKTVIYITKEDIEVISEGKTLKNVVEGTICSLGGR